MRLVCFYCSYTSSEGGYGGQIQALFPVIVNMESTSIPQSCLRNNHHGNVPILPIMVFLKKALPVPGKVQEVLNLSGLTGFFNVTAVPK